MGHKIAGRGFQSGTGEVLRSVDHGGHRVFRPRGKSENRNILELFTAEFGKCGREVRERAASAGWYLDCNELWRWSLAL